MLSRQYIPFLQVPSRYFEFSTGCEPQPNSCERRGFLILQSLILILEDTARCSGKLVELSSHPDPAKCSWEVVRTVGSLFTLEYLNINVPRNYLAIS